MSYDIDVDDDDRDTDSRNVRFSAGSRV